MSADQKPLLLEILGDFGDLPIRAIRVHPW
jgi:hypothetical protein